MSMPFGAHYHVSLLVPRIINIVGDMISSDFLSSDRWVKYARYIRVTKIVLEQSPVFSLLRELSKEVA